MYPENSSDSRTYLDTEGFEIREGSPASGSSGQSDQTGMILSPVGSQKEGIQKVSDAPAGTITGSWNNLLQSCENALSREYSYCQSPMTQKYLRDWLLDSGAVDPKRYCPGGVQASKGNSDSVPGVWTEGVLPEQGSGLKSFGMNNFDQCSAINCGQYVGQGDTYSCMVNDGTMYASEFCYGGTSVANKVPTQYVMGAFNDFPDSQTSNTGLRSTSMRYDNSYYSSSNMKYEGKNMDLMDTGSYPISVSHKSLSNKTSSTNRHSSAFPYVAPTFPYLDAVEESRSKRAGPGTLAGRLGMDPSRTGLQGTAFGRGTHDSLLHPGRSQQRIRMDSSALDMNRREKRKEQNRRAAKKCREKRKRAVDHLALEFKRVQQENEDLKGQIENMKRTVARLQKSLAGNHGNNKQQQPLADKANADSPDEK